MVFCEWRDMRKEALSFTLETYYEVSNLEVFLFTFSGEDAPWLKIHTLTEPSTRNENLPSDQIRSSAQSFRHGPGAPV